MLVTPEPRRCSLSQEDRRDPPGAGLGAAWELGLRVTSPPAVHPGIGSKALFMMPRNEHSHLASPVKIFSVHSLSSHKGSELRGRH